MQVPCYYDAMKERMPRSSVEFADDVDIARVPDSLTPVLTDSVDQIRALLGDKFVSLYLHGSTVRGDFVEGQSDLDAFVITSKVTNSALTAEVERIAKQLGETYCIKVDLMQRDIEDFLAGNLPNNSTVLAACGACYWGREIDFRPYVPAKDDMLEMLTGFYKEVLDSYSQLPEEELATKNSRRLLKFAVRTYGLAAVKLGAPFSTSIARQVEIASECLPDYKTTIREIEHSLAHTDTLPVTSAEALDRLRQAYAVYLTC